MLARTPARRAGWSSSRRRTRDHRGARAPDPRGGVGPAWPVPTSTSATPPSASIPATDVDVREHAEGRAGIDAEPLAVGAGVLRTSSTRPCRVKRTGEAELTKLLENTFRHVNIALVNELAMFAPTSASTSGRRSTRRRRSLSGSCGSCPGPGWAVIAAFGSAHDHGDVVRAGLERRLPQLGPQHRDRAVHAPAPVDQDDLLRRDHGEVAPVRRPARDPTGSP